MLKTKDYSIDLDDGVKYKIAAQVFLQTGQPEAKAYIEENIEKILEYFVCHKDNDTAKSLMMKLPPD